MPAIVQTDLAASTRHMVVAVCGNAKRGSCSELGPMRRQMRDAELAAREMGWRWLRVKWFDGPRLFCSHCASVLLMSGEATEVTT
jgi:hypothetical protein